MFETFWTRSLAIAVVFGANWVLGSVSTGWARDRKRPARARVLAAVRLSLLLLAGWLVLSQLVASSRGLSPVVQWSSWIAGALFALPLVVNSLAGLWLVSPLVGAGLGDTVVACGQPGRIAGYGLARLELETETGWTAHLLYLAVAFRPLLVSPQGGAPITELTFTKVSWTHEELSCLREAAILAPFRDLSLPVTVSQQENVVRVRLALVRPQAQEPMRRLLESALAAPRSA
jgi:uncharacterized membrane protein YhdT